MTDPQPLTDDELAAYRSDTRFLVGQRLIVTVDAARAERDAARDELLQKWELYRACNGAEVYDVIDPKIRKLYMQLNAKARGDDIDADGDPIQQWNHLVDLAVTAVVRWIVANRWAVNEHQRNERLETEVAAARAERDALRTENVRIAEAAWWASTILREHDESAAKVLRAALGSTSEGEPGEPTDDAIRADIARAAHDLAREAVDSTSEADRD